MEMRLSKMIYAWISEQVGWFTPEDGAVALNVSLAAVNSRLNLMLRQSILMRQDGRFRFIDQPEPPSDVEHHLYMLMRDSRYTDFIPRRLRNAHPRSL